MHCFFLLCLCVKYIYVVVSSLNEELLYRYVTNKAIIIVKKCFSI